MIQGRSRALFAAKALVDFGITSSSFKEKFEGDGAPQLRVFSPINNAHPAAAQRIENTVMRHHGVRQGTPPEDCAGTDRELRRSGCAPRPLVGQILDSVTTQVNATVAQLGLPRLASGSSRKRKRDTLMTSC